MDFLSKIVNYQKYRIRKTNMTTLKTKVLGINFENPFILASAPPIGKIGVLGVFDPKFFNSVQLRNAFYKELSIIGINSYSMWKGKREFEEALEIIEKNLNVFSQLISCREPLSNFNKLIQYISEKKQPMPIKVVFHP